MQEMLKAEVGNCLGRAHMECLKRSSRAGDRLVKICGAQCLDQARRFLTKHVPIDSALNLLATRGSTRHYGFVKVF